MFLVGCVCSIEIKIGISISMVGRDVVLLVYIGVFVCPEIIGET